MYWWLISTTCRPYPKHEVNEDREIKNMQLMLDLKIDQLIYHSSVAPQDVRRVDPGDIKDLMADHH